MRSADKFQKIRKAVARLQREKDRAQGALSEVLGRLRSDYGCKSLEDAEALLKRLRREARAAELSFNKAVDAFEEKWEHLLGS